MKRSYLWSSLIRLL
ncbi:hypothetical protein MP638_004229 [Amoeboaphelidium occidentale]|nr:hypothetical protein MP638_004229 [Amoeboaphelidium occidentale]